MYKQSMEDKMKKKENVWKEILLNNIIINKRKYILLLLIFIIGIVLGVFFINNSDDTQKKEINDYITNFITTLKENNSIDKNELLKESLKRNIIMGITLWFIGTTIVGLPLVYFFVLYKGLCIGYTMSSAILTLSTGKGIIFCISSILIHNIIIIPALLLIAVSGTNLCQAILKNRTKENIKLEIIRHSIISIIGIIFFMLSSLVEVYISTNFLLLIVKYI